MFLQYNLVLLFVYLCFYFGRMAHKHFSPLSPWENLECFLRRVKEPFASIDTQQCFLILPWGISLSSPPAGGCGCCCWWRNEAQPLTVSVCASFIHTSLISRTPQWINIWNHEVKRSTWIFFRCSAFKYCVTGLSVWFCSRWTKKKSATRWFKSHHVHTGAFSLSFLGFTPEPPSPHYPHFLPIFPKAIF